MYITKNIEKLLSNLIITPFLIQQVWIGETSTSYHVRPHHKYSSIQILTKCCI